MNKKLFVANISWNVSEEDVYHLFTGIGPVASLKLPIHRPSGRHRGYGFVEMENELDAQRVVDELNGMQLDNRPLAVNFQDEKRAHKNQASGSPEPNRKIFVRSIAPTVTEEALVELFNQHGTVESLKIPVDRYTGEQRTYGFAEMSTVEEATRVIDMCHEKELGGEPLQISYADPSRIKNPPGQHRDGAAAPSSKPSDAESSESADLSQDTVSEPLVEEKQDVVSSSPTKAPAPEPEPAPAFVQPSQPTAPFETPSEPTVFDPFEQSSPWT